VWLARRPRAVAIGVDLLSKLGPGDGAGKTHAITLMCVTGGARPVQGRTFWIVPIQQVGLFFRRLTPAGGRPRVTPPSGTVCPGGPDVSARVSQPFTAHGGRERL